MRASFPIHSLLRRVSSLATLALILPAAPVGAQGLARIQGRVLESGSGEPIAGATIEVAGTVLSARSAVDGRFLLEGVPPGEVTLRVRLVGFQPKTMTGLSVSPGTVLRQDLTLAASAVQLDELTVTAEAEQGSLDQALNKQRNSNHVMNALSAEQIARTPDSDAGQAIQRVSGVTLRDRKFVIVRGLGERYTVTSLNGIRVPSLEPEQKTVPLDLFPTSMLDGISTTKTFTPDQPGDFGGASVDLRTREFPGGRQYSFSMSVGANAAALRQDVVKAPSEGLEWLGFAGSSRTLPLAAQQAGDLTGLTDAQVNQVIGSFRNVWTPTRGAAAPNTSFGLSLGGELPAAGLGIGYAGSFSYGFEQEVRVDESRALARTSAQGVEAFNAYTGSSGRTSVLWGGMLNLTTRIGTGTKLSFNNSYSRSGDNEAISLVGDNEEFNETFAVTRQGYTERGVRSNQLSGRHTVARRHLLDWTVASSGVTRNEPDRTDLVYTAAVAGDQQPVPERWFGSQRSATKAFSTLSESGLSLDGNFRWALDESGRAAIKAGAAFRITDRAVDSRAYDVFNRSLTPDQRGQQAERIFDGEYAEDGLLTLFTNPNGGIYTAEDRIAAGYLQAEVWFGLVQVIVGARVEYAKLLVDSRSSQGQPVTSRLKNTDILPALSVNVPVDDYHNLRFGVSQTLARPEYRELSPVSYFEPLGGTITRGNPALTRTLIRNLDARWEWFPASGEVISAGVFAKQFDAPIEKTYVGTTGSANLSFINADGAWNYGVELELRKRLANLARTLAPFTVFANATLMRSNITPGNDSLSSLTSVERPMVGQSAYVVNAGLDLDLSSGVVATLLYNGVGPRIVEAGVTPLPDTYEQARHLIDLSLQVPFGRMVTFRLDARNLLDSPITLTQGPVTRNSYRVGRTLKFGVRYGN